ncbi:hypothetical protein CDAR_290081 [Caerostris darwini]|uniref:Uncharacterized protein n=1 Tax=Caerostris darwini TaxID=1538125 RepID=A0AAV4WYN7_9ARAC|nr:hypothetical protein CDAR_290081 [Caerostris darwini]
MMKFTQKIQFFQKTKAGLQSLLPKFPLSCVGRSGAHDSPACVKSRKRVVYDLESEFRLTAASGAVPVKEANPQRWVGGELRERAGQPVCAPGSKAHSLPQKPSPLE